MRVNPLQIDMVRDWLVDDEEDRSARPLADVSAGTEIVLRAMVVQVIDQPMAPPIFEIALLRPGGDSVVITAPFDLPVLAFSREGDED